MSEVTSFKVTGDWRHIVDDGMVDLDDLPDEELPTGKVKFVPLYPTVATAGAPVVAHTFGAVTALIAAGVLTDLQGREGVRLAGRVGEHTVRWSAEVKLTYQGQNVPYPSPVSFELTEDTVLSGIIQQHGRTMTPIVLDPRIEALAGRLAEADELVQSVEGYASDAAGAVGLAKAEADRAIGLAGAQDEHIAGTLEDPTSATHAAFKAVGNATYARNVGVTVAPGVNGIVGDGSTNDTTAFQAAIEAADGKVVEVLPGNYLLHNVPVAGVARLHIREGATLLHAPTSGVGAMFNFTGTVFRMRGGGLIDGNRTAHTGRPTIVTGSVQSGKVLDIEGLRFKSTVHAIARVTNFGGYLNFSHNEVTDQAQHTGNGSEYTTVVNVQSGEQDAKGLIRTNHNRCIFEGEENLPGSSPGGFFIATNGYVSGSPGSDGFADGNLSTWEAIGNYFEGYGQNCGPNDISPLHTYPTIAGARWVGNYFTKCGFCAVSAKSVQDFVFTGNVITDGRYSVKNISSEGAISYMPGYQAGTFQRPRAVISGNIVRNPGGESVANKQQGISVHGMPNSFASDFILSDNVIEGAGYGIQLDRVQNFILSGNRIVGSKDGANGTESGIRVFAMIGTADIQGNTVDTFNGRGLDIDGVLPDAKVTISGNTFNHDKSGQYALNLRGIGFLKLTGNTIHATAGIPLIVGTASAGGANIGHLVWDESNTIISASAPSFQYSSGIDKASGQLISGNDPTGRVTPAVAGTLDRPYGGGYEGTLWVATGTTSSSWAQLGAGTSPTPDGPVPSISVSSGMGTGATAAIEGHGRAGQIAVTPAADQVTGAVATVTFASARTTAPTAIILTPANVNGAGALTKIVVERSTLSTTGFSLSCHAALGTNTMRFYYEVID